MDSSIAGSQRALARRLGVAAKQVNKYVHDSRWTFGRGPWTAAEVEKIRAWKERTLAQNPAETGPDDANGSGLFSIERKVNVKLKAERAKKVQAEREILEGKYHRVDECERRRVLQIEEVKREFLALADSLPVAAKIKDLVRERLIAVCAKFAGE